jgi:hypothetical protein
MKRIAALLGLFGLVTAGYLSAGPYTDVLTVGQLTVTNSLYVVNSTGGFPKVRDANGAYGAVPATLTVVAAQTIVADACGGMKRITAAGSVTTNTTDTFTAPAAANKGCAMFVYNTGANTITLDSNAHFLAVSGADVALAQNEGVGVVSDGAAWYATTPKIADHT